MKNILYILLFAGAVIPFWLLPNSNLRMYVLDIGQGDSIYLSLPHGIDILIDTGPDDRVLAQLGQHMRFNDKTIELVVLSHFHSDHIGGFVAISQRYTIQQVWFSPGNVQSEIVDKVSEVIKTQHIATTVVQAGQTLNGDTFKLIALHPPPNNDPPPPKADAHDATIVLKLTYGSICILLTGDVNANHEGYIIAAALSLHESLKCQILKVTHHGSKTGSSNVFLANVQPELAVISVGEKNRYGHPGPETLDRLKEVGAAILRTDLNGTVAIETDGKKYWTRTEK